MTNTEALHAANCLVEEIYKLEICLNEKKKEQAKIEENKNYIEYNIMFSIVFDKEYKKYKNKEQRDLYFQKQLYDNKEYQDLVKRNSELHFTIKEYEILIDYKERMYKILLKCNPDT